MDKPCFNLRIEKMAAEDPGVVKNFSWGCDDQATAGSVIFTETVPPGYHYEPAIHGALPNGYHWDPHLRAVIAPPRTAVVVQVTGFTTDGSGRTSVVGGGGLDATGAAVVDRTSTPRTDASGGGTAPDPATAPVAVGSLFEHVSPPATGWLRLGRTELSHPTNTGNVAIILVSLYEDGGEAGYEVLFPGETRPWYRVTDGAVTIGVSITYPPGGGPRPSDVPELTYKLEVI